MAGEAKKGILRNTLHPGSNNILQRSANDIPMPAARLESPLPSHYVLHNPQTGDANPLGNHGSEQHFNRTETAYKAPSLSHSVGNRGQVASTQTTNPTTVPVSSLETKDQESNLKHTETAPRIISVTVPSPNNSQAQLLSSNVQGHGETSTVSRESQIRFSTTQSIRASSYSGRDSATRRNRVAEKLVPLKFRYDEGDEESSSEDFGAEEVENLRYEQFEGSGEYLPDGTDRYPSADRPANLEHSRTMSQGSSLNNSSVFLSRLFGQETIARIQASWIFQIGVFVLNSTRVQIYAYSAFNFLMLSGIIVIVVFIRGTALPSIKFYNFIHAIMGAIGKMAIISGFCLCQLVGKDLTANKLINTQNGVPLSTIAKRSAKFIPQEGILWRYSFLGSLIAVEATIWYMLMEMKWTGIVTEIGSFPCIPAALTPPTPVPNLGAFLMGDSSESTISNYGLPLADGLIGGFSAFPLAKPTTSFEMDGVGLVYATQVICDPPIPANLTMIPVSRNSMSFSLRETLLGVKDFSATLLIHISQGAHNAIHIKGDIQQICYLKYIVGDGRVRYTFIGDEWSVMAGRVDQVQLNSNFVLAPKLSDGYNFSEVESALVDNGNHMDIVQWFAAAFNEVTNNTEYTSMRQDIVPSIVKWSRDSTDGLYSVNQTWQGIAGVAG
ncbi:hypothetical protein HDU79_010648, partial [Rhizoclosmatium sp. JEL0117]